MLSYFLVSARGAIGSAAPIRILGLAALRYGQTFPFGTPAVNVTGSFIIDLFVAQLTRKGISQFRY